jgi:hypothetical protein
MAQIAKKMEGDGVARQRPFAATKPSNTAKALGSIHLHGHSAPNFVAECLVVLVTLIVTFATIIPESASAQSSGGSAPVITQIGPSSVTAGVAFPLGVWCVGCASSSVIQINGTAMSTTQSSPGVLEANVPATMLTTPNTTANVTVKNSDGSVSAPYPLQVVGVPVITQTRRSAPSNASGPHMDWGHPR